MAMFTLPKSQSPQSKYLGLFCSEASLCLPIIARGIVNNFVTDPLYS
ncbi:hypothetical protein SAMN05192574_109137 [Mucilaginibacter gossypiicola]|uniref:Uncharacterized protein n=1 Tax=Mucilaginibacter gossypiicola TaxID=551995 RepID=A0A1H8QTL3_9SPHI|nr:hypothetical protein SAMN05192574_109137 [Mucilaginibacter gossypiicola]